MNQPSIESVEEYEASMLAQHEAAMGREPVLFEVEDDDDDALTLIDREH